MQSATLDGGLDAPEEAKAAVCGELHHHACPQRLQGDWQHCPRCGSAVVQLSLHEVGQTELPDGGIRVKIEVRHAFPYAMGGSIEVIGPGKADRSQVGLLLPSSPPFFNVDIQPGESAGLSAAVRVHSVSREPDVDPFTPAHDLIATVTLAASLREEAAVEAFPALLYLAPGATSRVELHATGRPARLGHVDPGSGLAISVEGTPIVRPNHPAPASITATTLSGQSDVRFYDDSGRLMASTLVVSRRPAPMRSQARFLVGVDFGTSGTSVWRTDSLSTLPPVSLLSEDRPPTAVFVDRPTVRSTWRYGVAAEAARRERPSGTLVTEFKRYLQEEDDTIPSLGITASDLLAWYMGRLLEDGVYDRLAASAGDHGLGEGDVEWRITMPVYDGAERSARYRRRTLAAMQEAGLDRYGRIELLLEPECALRSLVRSGAFQRANLPIGARVMVVDGGGGTTDVAFGTLASKGAALALEDVVSYEVALCGARSSGVSCGTDFGGGDVTRLAGAYAIASYARAGDPETRYTTLARTAGLAGRGPSAFGFRTGEFFPTDRSEGFWHQGSPWLYEAVEKVKRYLSDNPSVGEFDVVNVGDDSLTLARSDVADSVGKFSEEYREAILQAVAQEREAGRAAPAAYALVGGNHILMGPEVKLPGSIRRVEVGKEDVRTAVVAGAALPSPALAPLSPFPLSVLIDLGEGPSTLLSYDRNIVVERLARSATYVGDASGTLRVEVVAEHEGPRLLRRFSVPFEPGTLSVAADLRANVVSIRVSASADAEAHRSPRVLEVRL